MLAVAATISARRGVLHCELVRLFAKAGKTFRTPSIRKRKEPSIQKVMDDEEEDEKLSYASSLKNPNIVREMNQNPMKNQFGSSGEELGETEEEKDETMDTQLRHTTATEIAENYYKPEPYEYDEEGAPIKSRIPEPDRLQIGPPIKYESEQTKISELVALYTSLFGDTLHFDLLYLENVSMRGVESIDAEKNVTISELRTRVNMAVLLDKLLGHDIDKITAFMCYRKEFITELELHYCIPRLARHNNFPDLVVKHPDLIRLITDQLSTVELQTFTSGAVLFKEVAELYGYTTPAEIIVNFMGNMTKHYTKHLFFPNDSPTFIPPIETLVRQGEKALSEQLALVECFLVDLFKHFADPETRTNSLLTMSNQLEGFFHHLFYTVKLFSVEQALRILEMYYQTVVMTTPPSNNVTLEEQKEAGEYILLPNDRIANLPFVEGLDVFLSENILQLNLHQASRVLFIFIRAGRTDCVFGKVISSKLEQEEKNRVAQIRQLAKDLDLDASSALLVNNAIEGNHGKQQPENESSAELAVRKIAQELKKTETSDFNIVFQLIWSLSHVKQAVIELDRKVWMLLEAMLIRSYNPTILVVPQQQVSILVSSFFKVGYGSDELWNDFMMYIKFHPKLLSVSIRCLVFHSLLTRGLLRSTSHLNNLKIFTNQIQKFGKQLWDLADTLAFDEKDVTAYDRLKIVMNLVMLAYLSNIENGFSKIELANRVRALLSKSLCRKLVGEEPILMIAVTKIIHETLKEEFDFLLKNESTKSTEIAIRREDLHGWTSFARVLYYLDRKLDNFTLLCPLIVYIYLGRLHLEVTPLASKLSLSDHEPLLDDLTIKRRVLHHQIQERCKGLDPWSTLMAIEICLVEDYMDETLLQHLVFKVSAALDNYSLDQVITIGLALKYFGLPTDHSFYELFVAVVDMLQSEMTEDQLDKDSPLIDILKSEFPELCLPSKLPKVDVRAKPGSLLHAMQTYQLIIGDSDARRTVMEYYWVFIAESGAGSVNLDLKRVLQPEETEIKQMISNMSPFKLAISN
jgi:hypothetical protein